MVKNTKLQKQIFLKQLPQKKMWLGKGFPRIILRLTSLMDTLYGCRNNQIDLVIFRQE
jgi:hypothetical protein